ncbi:MAG: hypothetical protein M1822_007010 [Bathelium mastoideum]|nr:MAG: hypothetical protein M1822_007010 [Bathelium mastoideum]
MAFTDDAVLSKLSGLVDTQESIVTVSQWVLFHRRHATRVAQLWMQRLNESTTPSKRLNYLYLANEVAQQSKIRKKDDFLQAFAPIIADATSIAYKGASFDIQQKIRRVVEVWRARAIFEEPVLTGVESRIDDLDRNRGSGKKNLLGGQLFGGSNSVPSELKTLAELQGSLTKAELSVKPALDKATKEYAKQTDPNATAPTPPVRAAQLSALIKSLAAAESQVADVIKARHATITELERIITAQKTSLAKEEDQRLSLENQKTETESKRREVEDHIIQGLSAQDMPQTEDSRTVTAGDPTRPAPETFTPPPPEAETFTPPESNPAPPEFTTTTGADLVDEEPPNHEEPPPSLDTFAPPTVLGMSHPRPESQSPPNMNGVNGGYGGIKKRKLNDEFDAFQTGDAMDEIDDDVAEMLERE